jgi:phosphatidylglycerophosphate synthase
MNSKNTFKEYIPSLITSIRVISAPLFFLSINDGLLMWSLIILIFAVLTDGIDGYLARKLDSTSSFGAYFDVTADFILIMAGFSAFILNGIYPFGLLLLLIFMFLQFVITSKAHVPIYGPLGKYYGSFLFLVVFITLIFPNTLLIGYYLY